MTRAQTVAFSTHHVHGDLPDLGAAVALAECLHLLLHGGDLLRHHLPQVGAVRRVLGPGHGRRRGTEGTCLLECMGLCHKYSYRFSIVVRW